MFWKKLAALALIFVLLTQLAACAAGAANPDQISETLPPEEPEEPPLTLEDIRTVRFADLSVQDPRADYVQYVAYQGVMQGSGENQFRPEGLVTRAALTAVLFRMSGEEAPDYDGRFSDVAESDWCAGAVAWALQADLFDSTHLQVDHFGPQESITRMQLAVMLMRHAAYMAEKTANQVQPAEQDTQQMAVSTGQPAPEAAPVDPAEGGGASYAVMEVKSSLEAYQDGSSVPEAFVPYVSQALEAGFFKGMISNTIYPNLPVSRGQLAQSLVVLYALETGEPLAAELAEKLQTKTAESIAQANHEALQAKVDEIAAKYGAVGLQAAVVENGEVTDSYAYGWATKNTDPMTPDHKLRVASLSKVSVGMAAMILRERGIIDLDAGIGDYWGFSTQNRYYPNHPVSIRSLLSHTSSIPLYGDDTSRARSAVESNLRNNRYNNMQPGSVYSWGYNNYGFAVLGLTLELAAGDYMDNILENSLWSVMDIDAAFETGSIQNTDLLATLYYHGGSVSRSLETQLNYKRPASYAATGTSFAGGLTISSKDLGKLVGLLVSDGRYQGLQLLTPESVEIMETRFDRPLSDGTYQALPLRSQDNIYGRDRLYYHTGSAYGVYNFMSYDPETGDGIVVLSIGASAAKDGNGIYAVCGEISKYFYELTAGRGEEPAAPAAAPAPAENDLPADAAQT